MMKIKNYKKNFIIVSLFLTFSFIVIVSTNQLNKSTILTSNKAATITNTVTVDTTQIKRVIPPTFLGINYVGFWDSIQGSAASQKALSNAGIQNVRFPGGAPADWYDWKNPYCQNWSTTSPLDLWNYTKVLGTTPQVMFQTNFQGNGAGCNTAALNSGQYQADWVTYNKQQGINAVMEVGNEEDIGSSVYYYSKNDTHFQPYIDSFITQSKAMHTANPNVKVYGPVSTNEWYWWGIDELGFFLSQTGNKTTTTGKGTVDGVSLHYYIPGGGACSGAANCWSSVINAPQNFSGAGGDAEYIHNTISTYDTRNLPIAITEWNLGDSDSGTGFNETQGHALIVADMLGSFAVSGIDSEYYFDTHSGYQYGLLYGSGESRAADTATPTYYATAMWSKMGTNLLNITQTSDPSTTISSYATTKSDGSVQVMSINKASSSQTLTVNYQNANLTSGTAKIYTLTPTVDYTSIDANYNGVKNPSTQNALPTPQIQSISNNTITYSIPAYSMILIDAISGNASVTNTPTIIPTNTPTLTPTKTLTPTPTPTKIFTPSPTATFTPTNTITPIASCLCGANNLCSTSCTFNKSTGVTYPAQLSCISDSIYSSSPTSTDKDSYCNRINRTLGDADGNGVVDSLDYIYYVRVVNGGTIPAKINTDINGDGATSVTDRSIIVANIPK